MATPARTERLDPSVFRLPVKRIRDGYYSDAYFNFSRELLLAEGRRPHVTMQVFQKQQSVLGGIDEAIAILKECSGAYGDDGEWQTAWDELTVHALHEGDEISPYETVMTIEGDYALFAHLETVYLGCLARRTLVMRRVREALDAAGHERVKIVASGGFDAERIREFERDGVPVDAYGVGSSLLRGQNDFTADVVMTDGRPAAKVGRRFRPNARLELVE